MIPAGLLLDRSSSKPLQRQLVDYFRGAIAGGTLRGGVRLPSTRELARSLGTSRNCIVNAFRILAAQGLIESHGGGGTRVAQAPHCRPRIPPSTRRPPTRRAVRMARIVAEVSSGTPGPFRPGVPPIDLFPAAIWRSLLSRRWRAITADLLAYDEGMGFGPLREAIAAHLGIARGARCDAEQVIIVSGAQQAIDLAARVLLEPGDVVCVEDPGYPGSRAVFAASGARVVPLPVDREGIDVEEGRRYVLRPRLVYVTPAHQYPLGVTMTAERRKALLRWAADSGAWLVEDDFGGEFPHSGPGPRTLQAMDDRASVIFIGTFSLSLAPMLRIGYLVAPHDLVPAFRTARAMAGRGPSVMEQATVADFIGKGHLARHLRRVRQACRERQAMLIELLGEVPFVRGIGGTEAGMHLVAYLQKGIDDVALSKAVMRAGIEAPALRSFAVTHPVPPALLLGYGSVRPEDMRSAVAALRSARRAK